MSPTNFAMIQENVASINRLYDTKERLKLAMIDAQDMYRSMVSIKAHPEKIKWAFRQQQFWKKAYWKGCNNYFNSLQSNG